MKWRRARSSGRTSTSWESSSGRREHDSVGRSRPVCTSPPETAAGETRPGYLLRLEAVWALEHEGDPDRGLELAKKVQKIGARLGDANLEALGIQDEGRTLVSRGRIDEGMQLMDEAMAAAVGGELDPETTGRSYCNMLSVCDDVGDYQRAGEWVEASAEWCENHSDSAYPGICRIYSAEMKWLRGAWDVAADEVRRAVEELSGFDAVIGVAWY